MQKFIVEESQTDKCSRGEHDFTADVYRDGDVVEGDAGCWNCDAIRSEGKKAGSEAQK